MDWQVVIGLEVHVQLACKSKLFTPAAVGFGSPPNTQVSFVDAALPGVLPVLNQEAVAMAIKLGLAIDAKISQASVFARKNYFYPDLPKGYQISQADKPIIEHGHLFIDGAKRITIERAHLEEDAGKSMHEGNRSCIDLNRAGTPLLEIVSAPELSSPAEAISYLKNLHDLVCYLGICGGNLQQGEFRCDANISLKRPEATKLGTRAELKNINSFRFVEKALEYEIKRQAALLEQGELVIQQTRSYDEKRDSTFAMRDKEDAHDYRYFPDPDLLPVLIKQEQIEQIRSQMPELPAAKRQRFIQDYGLSEYDTEVLTQERALADYFEDAVNALINKKPASIKLLANWLSSELLALLNPANKTIAESPIIARDLAKLIDCINDGAISGKMAKQVLAIMWEKGGAPEEIIAKQGMQQIQDPEAIKPLITQVMDANPNQVEQYRQGKDKLFGFFVGKVMQASKGQANPELLNSLLQELLKNI